MHIRFLLFAVVTMVFNHGGAILADELFEKPVRLKADGKIIDTGQAWGHSSPCIEDIDGDGLLDLILGDFGGKFQVYKNTGQNHKPVYKEIGKLQAGDTDASVRIYCCVGGQPRFVDLNGDGIRDMISSSYDPGHCYYFQGFNSLKFAPSQELLDQSGTPIRSAVEQQQDYQSFGSFFTPVDWEGDGDFDILIGCFDGSLKLRFNEGDSRKALFATENLKVKAGDEPLKVKAHCCPDIADWNNDGLWDILAGSDDGSVTWFKNVGTKSVPKFAPGIILIPKNTGNGYNLARWSEEEIVPGIRSQIEVVDHNGDGKLDIILGDFCTAYEFKKDLNDSQKQQARKLIAESESIGKKFSEKMEALRKEFNKKYPGDEIVSKQANEEWAKAYKTLRESDEAKKMEENEAEFAKQFRSFLAETRGTGNTTFDLAKAHGYVWLFLQK